MVDGADASGWSDVADGWATLWGSFADPVRIAIIEAAGIGTGSRVLDVGCGSGEFLVMLGSVGAEVVGADPAPDMVRLARATGSEVVRAGAEELPFASASFDVVTAVNALQFAEDTTDALQEMTRVVGTGGLVAIANWAEDVRNDIDVLERAVAEAREEEPVPDGPLRPAGGLEAALADAGLEVIEAGVADVPWAAADEATLVRGILLGEDDATMAELTSAVVAAAAPFADGRGGFVLRNAFRWAIARV